MWVDEVKILPFPEERKWKVASFFFFLLTDDELQPIKQESGVLYLSGDGLTGSRFRSFDEDAGSTPAPPTNLP